MAGLARSEKGHGLSRAYVVAAAVGAAILVGASIGIAASLNPPSTTPPPAASTASSTAPSTAKHTGPSKVKRAAPVKPKRSAVDPLTGGTPSSQRVIAAKIENIAAARPQVGIGAADIVFVSEVEGAQTRLIAIYHSKFPTRIGPVRSARSTDVQLLPLFGKPGLVYSGANSRVQAAIDRSAIVAIPRSTRDSRRIAPHNVFVDLRSIEKGSKAGRAQSIGWTFSADQPVGSPANKVSSTVALDRFGFVFGESDYKVSWNGQSYRDGDTGESVRSSNVVVMSVRNHGDGNRDVAGAPSVESDTVGRGKVKIYRDGVKITGTWRRSKVSGPLRFVSADGTPIALKPGKTWVLLRG